MGSPGQPGRAQRAARSAPLVLLAALALTSCGGGDQRGESPSTGPPPPPASAPEPAQRLERMLVKELVAQGLGAEFARCAAARIREELSGPPLAQAAEGLAGDEGVPAPLLEAAFGAGRRCASAAAP